MAELRFSGEALNDLAEISNYTARQWGEARSESYIRALGDCFALLAETPFIGRARPELAPDVRSWVCQEHAIFYTLEKDAVVIIRVLGSRRDIRSLFEEE
jgi:toxin ParE1/3/4